MGLTVTNAATEALARELARRTGASVQEALASALAEKLDKTPVGNGDRSHGIAERLMQIGRHCASLPDLDTRSADEILGYNESGLPG